MYAEDDTKLSHLVKAIEIGVEDLACRSPIVRARVWKGGGGAFQAVRAVCEILGGECGRMAEGGSWDDMEGKEAKKGGKERRKGGKETWERGKGSEQGR